MKGGALDHWNETHTQTPNLDSSTESLPQFSQNTEVGTQKDL